MDWKSASQAVGSQMLPKKQAYDGEGCNLSWVTTSDHDH
jgi:hypothetical protein